MCPVKPSDKEEEHFKKTESVRIKRLVDEDRARKEAKEKEDRKKLHYLKCPKCGSDLSTVRHEEIEVDRCGGCQGIWLDAGELDRLLEKTEGIVTKTLKFFSLR